MFFKVWKWARGGAGGGGGGMKQNPGLKSTLQLHFFGH